MNTFIKRHGLENILFFLGTSFFLFIAGIYFVNYLSVITSVLFFIGFFKV